MLSESIVERLDVFEDQGPQLAFVGKSSSSDERGLEASEERFHLRGHLLGAALAGLGVGLQFLGALALPAVKQIAGDSQLLGKLQGRTALYQHQPYGLLLELDAEASLLRHI